MPHVQFGMDSLSGMGFAGDDWLGLSGQPGLRRPDGANRVKEHLLLVWCLQVREPWCLLAGALLAQACLHAAPADRVKQGPAVGTWIFLRPGTPGEDSGTEGSLLVPLCPSRSWKGSGWGMKEQRNTRNTIREGWPFCPLCPGSAGLHLHLPLQCEEPCQSRGTGAAPLVLERCQQGWACLEGLCRIPWGCAGLAVGCWNLRAEDRE